MTTETLPAVNATLNAASTVLLLTAFLLIRAKKVRAHAYVIISALITSAAFLTCYLIHKSIYGERSIGLDPGPLKYIYVFAILLPHVVLAVVMLPMIGLTLYRAYRRDWARHRRIAWPTFLVWLYVSVTGVIIYFLLYHLFPTKIGA